MNNLLFALHLKLEGVRVMTEGLARVKAEVEGLNAAARNTAPLREAAGNLAMLGGGALAAAAAIALPLKGAVEGYEDLQNHVARLGAALGSATDKSAQLARASEFVKQQAVATGYSMDNLTESLYQGLSGFLNMSQAMAVSTQAAKVARATQGDLASTTNTLATMMLNFSNPTLTAAQNAQVLSDKLTAIQTQGKWTSITDLQYALKDSAPAMNAFGVSLDQGLGALSAWSAAGLDSSNAGEAFLEVMGQIDKASKKLGFAVLKNPQGGVDLLATVEEIKQKYAGMSRADFGKMMVEGFGLRAGPRLVDLIDKVDKFKAATDISANSLGATNRAFGQFTQRGTLQFQQFQQSMNVLKDTIGAVLDPTVRRMTRHLESLAIALTGFATAHPAITKFIVEFAGWGAVVLAVLGAVALLGASVAFIGSYVPVALQLVNVFKLWAYATKAVAGAQWLLNAAMDANPIGLVVAGVAALAVAAYEMYQHWAAVKGFFTKMIPEAFTWGVNLLKAFAKGIWSAITWPVRAIEGVLKKMRAYLPFSPAKEGPLRDLNRVRIIETIAATMKPAPMLSAMRRAAMVTALAAPLILGVGTAAMAASPARGRGAAVVVNYAPTINVGAGVDAAGFRRELEKHSRDIADLVERELERRARTELE